MLVLKRKDGQWIEVLHHSGDILRIRVYNVRTCTGGQVDLAFDDEPRHFEIRRPERIIRERQCGIESNELVESAT